MTCNGCRATVTQELSEVPGVQHVTVDLDSEMATIIMEHHIAVETFQKALSPKYSMEEVSEEKTKPEQNIFDTTDSTTNSTSEVKTKLQQLKPLLLILTYITIAALLLNWEAWDTNQAMLDFMGLFYIVFSFFKMLDLNGFPESFRMYDPLAKVFPFYGKIYPFLETVLGLMFLMRWEVTIALIVTLIVLGITTVGVTRTLLSKKKIRCACLGTALNLPMTEATFIENTIMLAMAIVMLIGMYS